MGWDEICMTNEITITKQIFLWFGLTYTLSVLSEEGEGEGLIK